MVKSKTILSQVTFREHRRDYFDGQRPLCVCEDKEQHEHWAGRPTGVSRPGHWRPQWSSIRKRLNVTQQQHAHTHHDCMLHKPRSLSLHAKPVWNPVKLQGFIDSQRHIWQKRGTAHRATFYQASQKNSKTSGASEHFLCGGGGGVTWLVLTIHYLTLWFSSSGQRMALWFQDQGLYSYWNAIEVGLGIILISAILILVSAYPFQFWSYPSSNLLK